jgi:catechol 2,3-dioxygenase-like lactoylglutathione lyase family enzyme
LTPPSAIGERVAGYRQMVAVVGLDHVVVAVSDWERSREFYARVLGAEVAVFESGRRALRIDSTQLNVHLPADLEQAGRSPSNLARIPVAPGGSDLCFRWTGTAEEAIEHLKRWKVEIELGPVERPGAHGLGKSVYFRDPDGSLLELISYSE